MFPHEIRFLESPQMNQQEKSLRKIQWPYDGQMCVISSLHFLTRKTPELKYEKSQQVITHFPEFYDGIQFKGWIEFKVFFPTKNGTVDPTNSSRCQILGSCVTQSREQRHFQETLCPSTALSTG